jgi:hypothetical protein
VVRVSRAYDPELAERSVRELAGVTDAELAANIRAAYAAVVDRAEAWRQTGWPREHWERVAYAALVDGRDGLAKLPVDAPLPGLVQAVSPVLGQWWPHHSAEARDLAAAVERLRAAALHRPPLVRDSRRLASQD